MRTGRVMAATAIMATVAAVPAAGATSGSTPGWRTDGGLRVVGLAGGGTQLVAFRTSRPGRVSTLGAVKGLTGDVRLVGIDFRIQTGALYGVGDAGGVYRFAGRRAAKVSQLSVALQGTSFGVDFNPAANRLRVISDTGQNLRHNIDDGETAGTTLTDGTLAYPPATGAAKGVTAAAYTNNDLSADTATTLFDLDTVLDQVAVQSPANAGSLAATGKLGADSGADAGFDIYGTTRAAGYAVVPVGGTPTLFGVNLLSGRAARVGRIGADVTDLAVPFRQR